VGSKVKKFKVGDWLPSACMVDSCRECASCKAGEEQYCDRSETIWTYNARDKQGNLTFGGYGNHIVCDEAFVLSVPKESRPRSRCSPAVRGITTYSPLKHGEQDRARRLAWLAWGPGHMAL